VSVAAIGEADLDLAATEVTRDVEAGVGEDAEHGAIPREDFRDEALDTGCTGAYRQLLQKACADAATLQLVGDREGDLGDGRVTQSSELGDGDDTLGRPVTDDADKRAAVVGLRQQVRDERDVDTRAAVEARVEALRGECGEEGHECLGVRGLRWS